MLPRFASPFFQAPGPMSIDLWPLWCGWGQAARGKSFPARVCLLRQPLAAVGKRFSPAWLLGEWLEVDFALPFLQSGGTRCNISNVVKGDLRTSVNDHGGRFESNRSDFQPARYMSEWLEVDLALRAAVCE